MPLEIPIISQLGYLTSKTRTTGSVVLSVQVAPLLKGVLPVTCAQVSRAQGKDPTHPIPKPVH